MPVAGSPISQKTPTWHLRAPSSASLLVLFISRFVQRSRLIMRPQSATSPEALRTYPRYSVISIPQSQDPGSKNVLYSPYKTFFDTLLEYRLYMKSFDTMQSVQDTFGPGVLKLMGKDQMVHEKPEGPAVEFMGA